jgi:hypothetical protein
MSQNTFNQFKSLFYNTITSLDPNIIPDIQGTDSYFKANATAQVATQVVQDVTQLQNNIIPSSSSGTFLDKHAGSLGMIPRLSATSSVGSLNSLTANTGTTAAATFTIPANTKLSSFITGNTYITLEDYTITSGTSFINLSVPIAIQSVSLGTNSYSPINSELTFNTPVDVNGTQKIQSAIINSMSVGRNLETDNELSERIFNFMVNPRGGGSDGDYIKWCFLGDTAISNAVIIRAYTSNYGILFPVCFIGSNNANDYIEQSATYPIERYPTPLEMTNVNTYILGVRPINDNPYPITARTYGLQKNDTVYSSTPSVLQLNVTVTLINNLTLSSNITLSDGSIITVTDLINREIRRAVISTVPFGTAITLGASTNYYILTSDLEEVVLIGLGSNQTLQGIYASILNSVKITFQENSGTPTDFIRIPSVETGNIFYSESGSVIGAYVVYDIETDTTSSEYMINLTVAS